MPLNVKNVRWGIGLAKTDNEICRVLVVKVNSFIERASCLLFCVACYLLLLLTVVLYFTVLAYYFTVLAYFRTFFCVLFLHSLYIFFAVGYHMPKRGSHVSCTPCAMGYFQHEVNRSICNFCLPGFSQSSTSSSSCENCQAGKYTKQVKSIECDPCQAGRYQHETGQASCLPCVPGLANKEQGRTECLNCKINSFAPIIGELQCTECPKGRTAAIGAMRCSICGTGTYKLNDSCIVCPVGFHQNTQNAKSCLECKAGFYANEKRMQNCYACIPGMYVAEPKQTACKQCDYHMYVSEPKQTQCTTCPAGYHSKRGSTECSGCEVGTYGTSVETGSVDVLRCQTCPIGWKRADVDVSRTRCLQCAEGQMTFNFGSTSCLGCDFGRYGTAPGVCERCVPGMYQDAKGQVICRDCPQDTYSDMFENKAKADCLDCQSVKTTGINNTGNVNVSACVCQKETFYQDANDCLTCPRGASCTRHDGVTIHEVYPAAGYWRSKPTDNYFSPCSKALVGQGAADAMAKARCCPLNSTTNVSQCNRGDQGDDWLSDHQCSVGYEGPLCMICSAEFIRIGVDCKPCPGGSDISGAIMSLVGVCAILMIFVFIKVSRTKEVKEKADEHSDERAHFVGELIILISYMQILSGLARTYGGAVEYPEQYVEFTRGMSFVNFDLAYAMVCCNYLISFFVYITLVSYSQHSLFSFSRSSDRIFNLKNLPKYLWYLQPFAHCSLSLPFQEKLILHLITPLTFWVSIQIAQFLAVQCHKAKKSSATLIAQSNVGGTIVLQLGMLLYPSLMTRVFSAFRCFPVAMGRETTRYFLEGDFSIACFENDSLHVTLIVPLAIVSLVVYTVGFPAFVVYELWSHRTSLHDRTHASYMLTQLRVGSLVESFEEPFWFWEPIIILYKMMLGE